MTVIPGSEFIGKPIGVVVGDSLKPKNGERPLGTIIAETIDNVIGEKSHLFLEVFSRMDADGKIGQVNEYDMKDAVVEVGGDRMTIRGHESQNDFFDGKIMLGMVSGFGVQTEDEGEQRKSILIQDGEFNVVYRLTKKGEYEEMKGAIVGG